MAVGNWEDFTSKSGFQDGVAVDRDDFEARATLVAMLNDGPRITGAQLRAVEYNRPGFHNPCMVLVLPSQGQEDEELLRLWLGDRIADQPLPAGVNIEEYVRGSIDRLRRRLPTSSPMPLKLRSLYPFLLSKDWAKTTGGTSIRQNTSTRSEARGLESVDSD